MASVTKHTLTGTVADSLGIPGEAEMQMLEAVLKPLVANGFEFRGGDTFGQEVVGIYMNESLDEYVMLRYNRPADSAGRAQPPLIVRGAMAELDTPMDSMESLRFVPVYEFLGKPAPEAPRAQTSPAANQNQTGYGAAFNMHKPQI
ncbi:MAG: hypothetical protein PW788_06335 [Micavibrio sp.]|nr:hypothetical protein [Micavibrio sp.]